MKKYSVAIDGPAGAGKSTVARQLAQRLGLRYLDTGAMYRAVTYAAMQCDVDLTDGQALAQLAETMEFGLDENSNITLTGVPLGEEIRTPLVTQFVSLVSSHSTLRDIVVRKQRIIAASGGIVMDGRDIGTTVLQGADLKIFLTADLRERARRRSEDLANAGHAICMESLIKQIEERDLFDSTRSASPLQPAKDAVLLDTTGLNIMQVVEEIVAILGKRKRSGACGGL